MRTTVTLDDDVERMLREAMHASRSGFKQTLNAAIRAGLSPKPKEGKSRRFVVRARALGQRPGFDPNALNRLADDLETEALLETRRKGGTG